jgi:predicted enzyme related to lactoylglutathione lyase
VADYRELFGWEFADPITLGELESRPFAWRAGGLSVGAFADIVGRPGVHPHWLFVFEVNDLEEAMAATRARRGRALPAMELPTGLRLCVCDDPQGAAFGLTERRRP